MKARRVTVAFEEVESAASRVLGQPSSAPAAAAIDPPQALADRRHPASSCAAPN